jgi:hypothetical protein
MSLHPDFPASPYAPNNFSALAAGFTEYKSKP